MSSLLGKGADYFPYPSVRPIQDMFTNTIYEAVKAGNHVLLEGSNGLGKTVAALSACLPVAREQGLQILYTAKTHRQHDRVIEELRALGDRGAIIFLEYRFATRYCRRFLPGWIRRGLKTLPDEDGSIAQELILFFGFPED